MGNNLTIETALSDDDKEAIINGVIDRIKPLLYARPELVPADIMSSILTVSPATLDRQRRAGKVPSIKIGTQRRYRPAAVLAALESPCEEGSNHE